MASDEEFYLPNEERFGFFTSHCYNLFSGIGPMKKFYQFVVEGVLAGKPSKILDVGFGTGQALKRILQVNEEAKVFGVEPSPHMFRVASRKLRKYIGDGRARLALGSSRKIPFTEKFDVIYSSLSFHHWQNQEESIGNILKHLEPDGRFMVFEYGDYLVQGYKKAAKSHAISREDLDRLGKVADFEVRESGEFVCLMFKPPSENKA